MPELRLAGALLLIPFMSTAANYSAQRLAVDGIEVVRLSDSAHKTEVSIVPSLGNNAYEMKVDGRRILWSPYSSLAEFKAKPAQLGNPFLAPWANRIDQEAYYANGKKFLLNPALENYRHDQNQKPIHGLVVFAAWEVISTKADAEGAAVTSRLEFWRHPEWMAQFPFAHTYEMTYRLRAGVLEVATAIENHSIAPMPVSVAFHTYYQIEDAPRDEWSVHLSAKDHLMLSNVLIPTGEKKPVAFADPLPLKGTQLDDVFSGLTRDDRGRAVFSVQGKSEKISVHMGPKYTVAVVYAPPGRNFICFEPMSGITNAFNLAHSGTYQDLQSIPPGGKWAESFWVQVSLPKH